MAIFDAHARDRLQLFMDGQNLFGTLRTLDKKIDYKTLMDTLREQTRLVRARYYTTVRPQNDNDNFRGVLDFLTFNGYTVEKKFVRDAQDQFGNVRMKGTMVGEMTAHMLLAAMNGTDHIVLFSGDSELTAAVEAVKSLDCRVTVVSSEETRVVSEDLRRACDHYVDIEDLPRNIILDRSENFRAVAA